jgi:hypothetical protein
MWHITSTLEAVKISLPGSWNAGRINQIVFVEIFDECGIAAGKLRGLEELFDQTFHGIALLKVAWVGRPATRGLQTQIITESAQSEQIVSGIQSVAVTC